jgi:cobalt/nickel transport system permease protein
MGAGRHRPLTIAGDTYIHRLAPECKLVATVLFVFAVVATPREASWAFAVYALALVGVARLAAVPLTTLGRRLAIETPFVAFALLLPIVGGGPRTEVLGVPLSVHGLWAAWNILVKGTLGVAASSLLVATTDTRDLLRALERLRVPKLFVGIAAFMLRYFEIVAGDMRAMRVARASRGYDSRWIGQARAVAQGAGALFVRSYERGERVYLAMIARGYNGSLPVAAPNDESRAWGVALALPVGAACIAAVAWIVR